MSDNQVYINKAGKLIVPQCFYKGMILKVSIKVEILNYKNHNSSEKQEKELLKYFDELIKFCPAQAAITLSEFPIFLRYADNAEERGITGFILMLKRKLVENGENFSYYYEGKFTNNSDEPCLTFQAEVTKTDKPIFYQF